MQNKELDINIWNENEREDFRRGILKVSINKFNSFWIDLHLSIHSTNKWSKGACIAAIEHTCLQNISIKLLWDFDYFPKYYVFIASVAKMVTVNLLIL